MIGYKLLRGDLTSISHAPGRVQYGHDWVEVPGKGAYVGLTLPGLLRGGLGKVLARVEYKSPTGAVNDGDVITARRVRVLQHAPLDLWALVRAAIWGARQVLPPKGHPFRPACVQAIRAAEECERERTLAAANAVWAARWAVEAAEAAEEVASRWGAVKKVDAAAASALRAALWAAESAKRAVAWEVGIAEEAAAEAASWSAARAAGAKGAALARRILERFAKEVF